MTVNLFLQYHAEYNCAGAVAHVVHSKCVRTARSANNLSSYILHIRAVTTNTVYRAPTKSILVGAEGCTISTKEIY